MLEFFEMDPIEHKRKAMKGSGNTQVVEVRSRPRGLGVSFKALFAGVLVELGSSLEDAPSSSTESAAGRKPIVLFAMEQVYLSCGYIPSSTEDNPIAILPRNSSFPRIKGARNEAPIATQSPALSLGKHASFFKISNTLGH